MGSPLAELSLSNPVIAAPMAGGATTPELVIAAAQTGSLGLLAGGMRPPELLAGDIAKCARQRIPSASTCSPRIRCR
jgi:nitronate monooxygenase